MLGFETHTELTWPSLMTVIPAPATERNSTQVSQSCAVDERAVARANATANRFMGSVARSER